MSKKYNIHNLEDLHAEVRNLKASYRAQELMLKQDAKTYLHQFTIGGLIKKYATPSAFVKLDDKLNISSKIMSLVLPLIMNNTFFRGSGLITKALVGLASGKVGKTLDAEHLSAIVNSVKSWFSGSKKKKAKSAQYEDYGIPPDSETY